MIPWFATVQISVSNKIRNFPGIFPLFKDVVATATQAENNPPLKILKDHLFLA